jgi:hypothetical protein
LLGVGALFAGSVPNFLQDLKIGAKNDVSLQCFTIPASAVEVWEAMKSAVNAVATMSVRFMAVVLLAVGYNHPPLSVAWEAGRVRRFDGNIAERVFTRQRANALSAALNWQQAWKRDARAGPPGLKRRCQRSFPSGGKWLSNC